MIQIQLKRPQISKEIQSHLRLQNYLCGPQGHLGNQISAQISLIV